MSRKYRQVCGKSITGKDDDMTTAQQRIKSAEAEIKPKVQQEKEGVKTQDVEQRVKDLLGRGDIAALEEAADLLTSLEFEGDKKIDEWTTQLIFSRVLSSRV